MSFGPEKPPPPPDAIVERTEPSRENAMEMAGIAHKGLIAALAGLVWLEWKILHRVDPVGGLPGGELSKEDSKKVEEQGWLRTAFEKAEKVYGVLGGIEKLGKIDDIFERKS